jgi:hypothetical protein
VYLIVGLAGDAPIARLFLMDRDGPTEIELAVEG